MCIVENFIWKVVKKNYISVGLRLQIESVTFTTSTIYRVNRGR